MTHRSRQVIAVTLVAAALCADRVAVAAPAALRVAKTTTASQRLVQRLTTCFRRVVPADRVIVVRQDGVNAESRTVAPQRVVVTPQPTSPFQFRLPPPTH